jgi:integrase
MIYQRKTGGNWTAAFYVKGADGKLVKKAISTGTTDEATARDIERQLQMAVAEGVEKRRIGTFILNTIESITGETMPRAGMPLSLVWDKVKTDASQLNRSKRTMASKRQTWERFCEWMAAERPIVTTINEVTRHDCKEYLQRFAGKKGSTLSHHKAELSSIWSLVMIEAELPENPWKLFKGGESDYVSFRAFDHAEVLSLMKLAGDGSFWHNAVAIAWYTGLRLKDVVHLRLDHFQREKQEDRPEDLFIVLAPAKTGRNRKSIDAYVHTSLRRILEPIMASAKDFLFPEMVKRYAVSSSNVSREFSDLLFRAKIQVNDKGRVGFPSLRATFITNVEKGGVSRQIVQGIVGHDSPARTGRYSKDRFASRIIEQALPDLLAK